MYGDGLVVPSGTVGKSRIGKRKALENHQGCQERTETRMLHAEKPDITASIPQVPSRGRKLGSYFKR